MCGFVVWIDRLQSIDLDKLEELRDLLQHRGPDDVGLYISPDFHIGFGFRRLSIIDLSPAGHQPMSNADGSIWIVFNGEVYNYAEIRPELETRGYLFRSQTDTEVLLHAYEEWGEDCVEKFIGMFALVIWDNQKKKLFAARDRLGIKPLYYSATAHGLCLASELKSIIDVPGFSKEIDFDALQEYLAHGYISSPRTIFQFANSLLPGHILVWNQNFGEISIRQYWSPLEHLSVSQSEKTFTDQEWIDALDSLLRSAVKYRLISDVPLGVFLSGGIDSSLIAALMREVSNGQVKTFTIGFEETKYDEAYHAQELARYLGTTHTLLQATYRDAQEVVCQLADYYDEPFADSSQIPTYLVSKLARQHVTVALSGDGGDELFCGYETYRLMERWQHFWKLPQLVRDVIAQAASFFHNEKLRLAAQGLALPDPFTFASYYNGYWRPQEIKSLLPILKGNLRELNSYSGVIYLKGLSRYISLLEGLMLIDLQRYLPNDILTKLDRASMAVSLEARVPLLDHRVVELALKMPFTLKRRNGKSKYALRQVLYRYVPRELVDRPKQGFGVPLDEWLRTDLHELLERYLDPSLLRRQGLFEPEVVSRQLKRFKAQQAGHSRVWSLLMFQMWAERYLGLKV
jgi:asparagine synthase (glutamine-hydrolysing)